MEWPAVLGLIGLWVAILGLLVTIWFRLDSKIERLDTKIDNLTSMFSVMGFELASRVGRLEGKAESKQEPPLRAKAPEGGQE